MSSSPKRRGRGARPRSPDAAPFSTRWRDAFPAAWVLAIAATLGAPSVGAAQSTAEQASAAVAEAAPQSAAGFEIAAIGGARSATAVESAVAPVLDGAVLDDPAWALAPPATGFVQTQPDEGRPASERTEVRIVYTADTIYFGVICYDDDPSAIIVTDSRRDSSLADSDSFQLILDTFLDRQNGFIFGTSPSGQEYDGQLVNEGAGGSGMGFGGGGQIGGAGGGFNQNWDGRVAGADGHLRRGLDR